MERDTTVRVMGAGLAGLTAARELQRRGIDVLVEEAADRAGGRATSETTGCTAPRPPRYRTSAGVTSRDSPERRSFRRRADLLESHFRHL
ncbi:FAD-dependent oxidoreductase [Rhodococcoides kyotonense]|uniref:FAD-dependent oxidoreductase n=1 Tax=Rhodococcoides kyotonense TaxID=398843 RepID=UPI000B778329|nr:FAD/NAD(P)-binding protein [Rhodococcus kyotonensis]